MEETLLLESFKYFAKFPPLAVVQKLFNKSTSDLFGADYTNFKTEIDNLEENSLISELTDFIFAFDVDQSKKYIEDVKGIYLLIDYGNITFDKNEQNVETSDFLLAVTIAWPLRLGILNMVESALQSQKCLNTIISIKEKLKTDSKCNPFLKQITFPGEITPWYSRDLASSNGWTMVFRKSLII